jgi:hypothetical protein
LYGKEANKRLPPILPPNNCGATPPSIAWQCEHGDGAPPHCSSFRIPVRDGKVTAPPWCQVVIILFNIAALLSSPSSSSRALPLSLPVSFHAHTPLLQSQLSLQVLLTATATLSPPAPQFLASLLLLQNLCWLRCCYLYTLLHLPYFFSPPAGSSSSGSFTSRLSSLHPCHSLQPAPPSFLPITRCICCGFPARVWGGLGARRAPSIWLDALVSYAN